MPIRNSRWKAAKKARDCKAAKASLKRSEAKDEVTQDHPDVPKTIEKKLNETISFVKANQPCVVLSTLLSGSNYQPTRTSLLMSGVRPWSRATFYIYQAEIGPKIVSFAKKSCQEAMIDLKTYKFVSYYDTINDRKGKNTF